MDDPAGLSVQLEPLRTALMAEARRDAETRLAQANERAAAIRAEAEAASSELLARAAAEGDAAAARQSAHGLVDAQREGRRRVLAAQRGAYDRLFAAALVALEGHREQSEFRLLEDRLERVAMDALGGDVSVQRDPNGLGGVVARSEGRVVDLTLPVLVKRCIVGLGQEVARLWQ